jgi:hypothetical protein
MKDFKPTFLISHSQKTPIPFAGYIISMNMLLESLEGNYAYW